MIALILGSANVLVRFELIVKPCYVHLLEAGVQEHRAQRALATCQESTACVDLPPKVSAQCDI